MKGRILCLQLPPGNGQIRSVLRVPAAEDARSARIAPSGSGRGPIWQCSRLRGGFLKPWMDKALPELLALAALAAFGCGLALAQDDFAFAAIFAVESALIIVEVLRCLR